MTTCKKSIRNKMATSIAQTKLPILRDHFTAAVGKSSIVVKAIAITVIIGYILSFISSAIPFITVTPGYVMPPNFNVYSFGLYCFVELHFWHVLADVAVIILFGKLLEPLWGAPDMLLFFIIVNLGVGVITACLYYFIYLVTLNEQYLFEVHIYGLSGYIAGFCVAVKQVMPDHCLATLPFGKLRNTHIPLTLLVLIVLLRIAGLLPGPYPYMFTSGIIVSWVYLRFYQKHTNGNRGDMADNFSFARYVFLFFARYVFFIWIAGLLPGPYPYMFTSRIIVSWVYLRFYQKHTNGNRGDMADNFSFASFFPSQFQPVIAIISNSVFSGLVKIKLCKKPQRRYDVSSPTTITVTLPGTEPHDAERRKQLALKALNERLGKSESASSWPATDDESPASPPATPLGSTASQQMTSKVSAATPSPAADTAKQISTPSETV